MAGSRQAHFETSAHRRSYAAFATTSGGDAATKKLVPPTSTTATTTTTTVIVVVSTAAFSLASAAGRQFVPRLYFLRQVLHARSVSVGRGIHALFIRAANQKGFVLGPTGLQRQHGRTLSLLHRAGGVY